MISSHIFEKRVNNYMRTSCHLLIFHYWYFSKDSFTNFSLLIFFEWLIYSFFIIDILRQTWIMALLKKFSIIKHRTWITADPVRHARAPALFTTRLPANVTRLRAIVLLETDFRLQCTHVAAEWSAAQPRSDTLPRTSRPARQTLKIRRYKVIF